MPEINFKPTAKQFAAWELLNDSTTNELLYGGSAGGGKSYIGCMWLAINCMRYPGTRWLMGRAVLKTLKESTLLTFFEVCNFLGLKMGVDYKYMQMQGRIVFTNYGSEIYLKDLFAYPSDPEFDELGSTEYTGAFIDEASQIASKAYEIVKSRMRYKLEKYNLIPKILIASNPTKNFLYGDFYKPWRNKSLPIYRKFIPALADDNPHLSPHYIENLKKLDTASRERLLYGNWEYNEGENNIFNYDRTLEMFRANDVVGTTYLTVDVARFGKDISVYVVWSGWNVIQIISRSKISTAASRELIMEIMTSYNIPLERVLVDEDGIGGGIVDELKCRGFVNNSRPVERKMFSKSRYNNPLIHNFANLKAQCYFLLSEKVNKGEVSVYPDIKPQIKELLIEDLEQIRQKDPDKDGRLTIVPKDKIKERIGRSTDYSDAFMMRVFFDLKPTYKPFIAH